MRTVNMKRYSRHIVLKKIGSAGQKKLLAARVLVVGVGGLGSPAALYLAAAGVGCLGIVDDDEVEISNLQRQVLYGPDDIGHRKVTTARERLERFNPDVKVEIHETLLTPGNAIGIIERYDFVIDGTDSMASKFLINDACVTAGKPFVHAGIGNYCGQVLTCVPRESPCCRCAFGYSDDYEPKRRIGVIGAVCGVTGSLEAMEAIKYITGAGDLLTGRILTYDALAGEFRTMRLAPRDGKCPVCGTVPKMSGLEETL
jgi:molybdopterin/thiamine biosynthesis adenylyltransferase